MTTYELRVQACDVSTVELLGSDDANAWTGTLRSPELADIVACVNVLLCFFDTPDVGVEPEYDGFGDATDLLSTSRYLEVGTPGASRIIFMTDVGVAHFRANRRDRGDALATSLCQCLSRIDAAVASSLNPSSSVPESIHLAVGLPSTGDTWWTRHPHGVVFSTGMEVFRRVGRRDDLNYLSSLRRGLLQFMDGGKASLEGWTDLVDSAIAGIEGRR